MQHLRGHDDGLFLFYAFADDAPLDAGNLLQGHLDAQIATGNQDTIGSINNLVNIIDTLLVLNL